MGGVTEMELEHAPRFRRLFALLIDLSLFVALTLALSPLLPATFNWKAAAGLGGFVLLISYYYFVGMWLLWGRTIGGTIFDVKVISPDRGAMAFGRASQRWAGVLLSLLTGGLGFALAALPSRLSLADRLSGTRCVSSR
jgi:uncharacterized RDD family membrane protein YckC